jgi:D-alanine-D-alanine ligase
MDKGAMKGLLAAAGLPVGPYVVLAPRDWARDADGCLERVRSSLSLPVFVKPSRGGSSLGISKVSSWDDLPAAVATARAHDPRVVVEQGLPGREVECGVLDSPGGGVPVASALAEVRVGDDHEFYDFAAKYLDGGAQCDVPADLPDDLAARVRELAVAAFEAMGCEGLARVDFFVLDDGRVLVNEVNTMPGFTPTSMFPRMWAASGVDYPALVQRLLEDALRRGTGLR